MILRWSYLLFIIIPVVVSQDLTINTADVTKKVNENIYVTCSTTDSSNPQLKWLQGDTPITSTDINSRISVSGGGNRLSLLIKKIQETDAGSYFCEGVVNGSPQRQSFTLSVYTGITIESEPKQYPIEKSNGLISCQVSANPKPRVRWGLPSGTIIDMDSVLPRYKQTQQGLEVKNITKADDGHYRCMADVPSHQDFAEVLIDVKVTIVPTMPKPPTLDNGISGEPFTMNCEAKGDPVPKYRWYKDESNIPLGDGTRVIVNDVTGELKITKLQPEDEGKYKCVAYNIGGKASGEAGLKVYVPPTIESIKNGTANEGERASIQCVARGKPAPAMQLKPQGGDSIAVEQPADSRYSVDLDKDEAEGKSTLTFVINKSKATDIGTYECTATNTAGETQGNGQIMIEFKPNFLNTPYAEKFSWPGSEAEIKCVANGNPIPVVTWKKDKQPVSYSPTTVRGERQVNSTIKFKITEQNKESVFGVYNCSAVNIIGESYQEIMLREATKPGMPGVSLGVFTTTRVYLRITRPSLNGGVDVNRYIVRYLIEGKPDSELTKVFPVEHRQESDHMADTRSQVELRDLTPNKKYIVGVRAGNAVGLSDEFITRHQTPDLSKPFKVDVTSSQYGENSDKYTLQWTEPDDGGAPIIWYIVKWQKVAIMNESDSAWKKAKVLPGKSGEHKVSKERTFYLITGLDGMSYYEVSLTATNAQGTSDQRLFIFRTSNVSSVTPGPSKEKNKGMSTGAVIGIVIAIFFVLFIIVDVTCYVTSKCGILNLIVEAVQERRTQGKDKHTDIEAGDSDKKEPLLAGDEKADGKTEEGSEAKETTVDIEQGKELEPEDKENLGKELEPEDKEKSVDPEIEKSDFKPEEEEPDNTEFNKDTEPIAGDKDK